jgi:hypothetical protein
MTGWTPSNFPLLSLAEVFVTPFFVVGLGSPFLSRSAKAMGKGKPLLLHRHEDI